jgi:Sec63 Brl domain
MQVKEEGWWLVLSDAADTELLALKRLSFTGERTVSKLAFPRWDADTGEPHAQLQLRILSDSYLGLDQSFAVAVGRTEATAEAVAA